MTAALHYLRSTSEAMTAGYSADCVTHACAVADLLLAEGASPWIGRLRHVTDRDGQPFHEPLIPTRFRMLTWNTHYVCCLEDEVYDPIVGEPVAIDRYAAIVFGRHIPIQEHLTPEATAELLRSGGLRKAFHPTRL